MQNPDVRVPPWFAIKRLGVTKQTFNYWRDQGKLVPDADGAYRWGDCLRVEAETRNSPNSRRGVTRRPATGGQSWAAVNVKPA